VVGIDCGFCPFRGIEDGFLEWCFGDGEVLFGSGTTDGGYASEAIVVSWEMGSGSTGEGVELLMRIGG